jgi:hypothetical protein
MNILTSNQIFLTIKNQYCPNKIFGSSHSTLVERGLAHLPLLHERPARTDRPVGDWDGVNYSDKGIHIFSRTIEMENLKKTYVSSIDKCNTAIILSERAFKH